MPRFSASGGKEEDGGIEPLQLPVPQGSSLVADSDSSTYASSVTGAYRDGRI
ncbi:MAG: hypothetical protein V7K42_21960 [Nostoc sp.]